MCIRDRDYGILTLMVQYLSDTSIAFLVPKESFIPAPNVTSVSYTHLDVYKRQELEKLNRLHYIRIIIIRNI